MALFINLFHFFSDFKPLFTSIFLLEAMFRERSEKTKPPITIVLIVCLISLKATPYAHCKILLLRKANSFSVQIK